MTYASRIRTTRQPGGRRNLHDYLRLHRPGSGSADPLLNTVTAVYDSDAGLIGAEITNSDSWSVNLFQPSVDLDKSGPALGKIGDEITYSVTITNTSSADSPVLNLVSFNDSLVTTFTTLPAACTPLAVGASCTFTYTYTPQPGDPDPLVNTATVHYNPAGFPNDIWDADTVNVELFQPSITLDKTGDVLSKIGDGVTYTITLNNTSSADTPNMVCTISDPTIGFSKNVTLASGGSDVSTVPFTIPAGCFRSIPEHGLGDLLTDRFPNEYTASDGHSINLFQPAISLFKTGDSLSKIGDDVSYTITLNNDSSADTPDLACDVSDPTLGFVASLNFKSGTTMAWTLAFTIPAEAADPFVNTVSALCSPAGFANVLEDTAVHSTNLFQPSVDLTKTCDELSKIGDLFNCQVTIDNTSSLDSPGLVLDSFVDSLVPGAVYPSKCSPLLPEASCSFGYSYTPVAGDPDPLVNTATIHFHPEGFLNDIWDAGSATINLFQPSVNVTKTCDALSKIGDTVNCTVTIENTSSADSPDLVLDSFSDSRVPGVLTPDACSTLASGASCTVSYNFVVDGGDTDPLVNVATAYYHPFGFPNVITDSASWETNLFQPSIMLLKTGDELSKIGDPVDYVITLVNTSSVRHAGPELHGDGCSCSE